MSWIRTVPDDQWEGELEPLHGRVVDRDLGRVDHIMAVHSINPEDWPPTTASTGRRWRVPGRCARSSES